MLKYTDDTLRSTFLASFNTMRKHRLFCDVILNVSKARHRGDLTTDSQLVSLFCLLIPHFVHPFRCDV